MRVPLNGPVLLTSFDLSLIQRIRRTPPRCRSGSSPVPCRTWSKPVGWEFKLKTVVLIFQVLNPNTLEEIRRHHRNIFAWTVDRAEDLRRVVQLGVDGVISNKPDEVRRVLAEFG
ncbi:MAG: glycerophosphodiester phosphodiesterase family protein [Terriglobia bacterium]